MLDRRHHRPMRRLIASELIGVQHPRRRALPLEEFAEEPLGGLGVGPARDEDVEDVAVLVDGPPQILTTAVDRQEHLVVVPLVAGSGLAAAQAGRVDGSELGAPLPDRSAFTVLDGACRFTLPWWAAWCG